MSTTLGRAETRQYLITCEGCTFERTADGREEATEIGSDHRRETDHAVVAVEVPPSIASSHGERAA
ncbi:hypothetical protein [Natrialbaceae archaeon AArc-T1-2]|uniref:hypothetical protein n=1 Tax=Natrialbaceae archaeon AArc-T1-2 TaxID=3053904 RepID=UPI00255B39A9|nr:hypothetical protein [Natrialbaceae archaeon AArc-T1-2]WIV67465.1 hypothetical protein QQ977_01680 [Natrialbaceae archaeon AArc-T1-2]